MLNVDEKDHKSDIIDKLIWSLIFKTDGSKMQIFHHYMLSTVENFHHQGLQWKFYQPQKAVQWYHRRRGSGFHR